MNNDSIYSITSHYQVITGEPSKALSLVKPTDTEGVQRIQLTENLLHFIRIRDPNKKDFWKKFIEKFTYVNFKVKDSEGNIKKIALSIGSIHQRTQLSVSKILKLKLSGNLTLSKLREKALENDLTERREQIEKYSRMIKTNENLESDQLFCLEISKLKGSKTISVEEVKDISNRYIEEFKNASSNRKRELVLKNWHINIHTKIQENRITNLANEFNKSNETIIELIGKLNKLKEKAQLSEEEEKILNGYNKKCEAQSPEVIATIYKIAMHQIQEPEILFSIKRVYESVTFGMRNVEDNLVGASEAFINAIDSLDEYVKEIEL